MSPNVTFTTVIVVSVVLKVQKLDYSKVKSELEKCCKLVKEDTTLKPKILV